MSFILEQCKRPLRRVKRWLHPNHMVSSGSTSSIIDHYSKSIPSDQQAIDLFKGEWASRFPACKELIAGQVGLFEDERVTLGLERLGSIEGQRILELGPLEGGHSYMLEMAGAKEIIAIEANPRAYLKCLIAKEVMGMRQVKFQLGDFLAYLRQSPPSFDMVLASGVLYHQSEPVELIQRLSFITDRILLWSHYYDEARIRLLPHYAGNFKTNKTSEYGGFQHTLHLQEYQQAIHHAGFCGAGATYSYWMSRQDILNAFTHFGYSRVDVLQDTPEFINGPAFLLAIQR